MNNNWMNTFCFYDIDLNGKSLDEVKTFANLLGYDFHVKHPVPAGAKPEDYDLTFWFGVKGKSYWEGAIDLDTNLVYEFDFNGEDGWLSEM